MTTPLKLVQESFIRSLCNEADHSFEAMIHSDQISAVDRLGIYRNHMYNVLTNLLRDRYPVVCALVSDDFFDYMASEYIAIHPSQSGNLDDYGDTLSEFLTSFEPTQSLAYLPDVATFEQLMYLVHIAPDHSDTHDRPSYRLMQSDYPIDRIVDMTLNDSQGDETIDISNDPVCLLIYRKDYKDYWVRITPQEYDEYTTHRTRPTPTQSSQEVSR